MDYDIDPHMSVLPGKMTEKWQYSSGMLNTKISFSNIFQ